MDKLNYDFKYIEDKTKGYRKSQVFNSALPSTYTEKYSFKKKLVREDLYGLVLIVIGLILWGLLFAVFTQ